MTAHALARAIAADLASSQYFAAVFLDSVGTDEELLEYPYAVVAPSSLSHTPGGDEITIEVGMAIREDLGSVDSSKPELSEDGVYIFGFEGGLDELIAVVRERLSAWTLGAIPAGHDSVSCEFGSYPVQSAILSFSFNLISTFED